ncbi:MAG: LVIVD repeat-containing protein [Actinomycetes bacterium]
MRRRGLAALTACCAAVALVLGTGPAATAEHDERPHTQNLKALGHLEAEGSFVTPTPQGVNTDLAFWGKHIFQGTYGGFRVVHDAPGQPREISFTECTGNQGDVVVWEDVLVRSWNSPAPAGATCDGQPVPAGFEGLHVFDISDVRDPELVAAVPTACGSHTATGVPDTANDRLLVYNNGSSPSCPWFEVVDVPLSDPDAAAVLRVEPLQATTRCHDIGVILGDVMMATCAAGGAANVFSLGGASGGTLEDPAFLYSIAEPGVGTGGSWHSAAFTWDGEVIVLGWEPGGGAAPECEATDPDVKKSMFFYDSATGQKLGQWTLPRPQTAAENCTIHNFNVVPLEDRYVVVSGNYQAGTWVTEFTDPANPVTVAWSDPEPLVPTQLGGAWSSYWYNNTIYESSITEGLNVFRLSGPETAGALQLEHLNPQTQEFSL